MIKSILLPIDGSPYSESVLDYGIFFAKKFDSVLRIITVVDIRLFDWSIATGADSFVPVMPSVEFQEESQKMLDEKAQKVLEKASSLLQKTGLSFEVQQTTGIPVDEICSHAKENDMVIMGIRGDYERWSNKLLGVTVEAVTHQISKPLFLVDKEFKPFTRIHCGYDGSVSANKALQLAAFLANKFQLELQVISIFNLEEERNALLKEAEKYLQPYDIDFDLRHESGDAADVLVSAQNNSPSPTLTIIGSYGHSRLREAILGSTTVQVMRKANKPVLLAK